MKKGMMCFIVISSFFMALAGLGTGAVEVANYIKTSDSSSLVKGVLYTGDIMVTIVLGFGIYVTVMNLFGWIIERYDGVKRV
jgi:hypothetical protein